MTTLSPKEDFLNNEPDLAKELNSHREDKWLKTGLNFALAEAASRGLPAPAIVQFCDIFLQLGMRPEPIPSLPVQELTSWDAKPETQEIKAKE